MVIDFPVPRKVLKGLRDIYSKTTFSRPQFDPQHHLEFLRSSRNSH